MMARIYGLVLDESISLVRGKFLSILENDTPIFHCGKQAQS